MDQENEHKSNVPRKPSKDHPWRKMVQTKVSKWAKEESTNVYINNWKKGGGHDPWNK